MAKVRTFIAIELPHATVGKIITLQDKLKGSGAKVKYVRRENMHLTVKFLGDVAFEETEKIAKEMTAAAADVKPFVLRAKGAGSFPKGSNRPRVIWVGLEGNVEPLEEIYEKLNESLVKYGVPYEKRKFSPHITIGRVRSSKGRDGLKELIDEHGEDIFGEVEVAEIMLMMSELTPKGPIYSRLATTGLGG